MMNIRILRPIFALASFCILLSCKKSEAPSPLQTLISFDKSTIELQNDKAYLGIRLTANIENLPPGESDAVVWSSENPRIATVSERGEVWPVAAGETFVYATMVNGKGVAKCKVIVTDANDYKFRLVLKDKGASTFSINQPEAFLSAKAIQRRRKWKISIDESDLPISPDYIKAIQKLGGKVVAQSKWLNSVTVICTDQFLADQYKALPFVQDVVMVWSGKRMETAPSRNYVDVPQISSNHSADTHFDYGEAVRNISPNNGQVLHKRGFKGAGIDIAVLDDGFINMKNNPAFRNVNIKGAKSFIYENDNPYAVGSHGIWVTSCMAVNQPGVYVGTAPEANYWLFRTEDNDSEHPVEEDYWVSAAEYADSVGVDVINSSLHYSTNYSFIDAKYKFEDMDGKTAFISRAANMASNKGILVVNCAGNDQTWVGAPADSPNVLTVGSIHVTGIVDPFTSWGITVDGRMKPDILAVGGSCKVIGLNGVSETRSGTSYASPNICGLVSCLWQAYPQLTNKQLIEVIRKSGDHFINPKVPFGYGVADMQKAFDLAAAAVL